MSSPTQKTLEHLEECGWVADIVERRLARNVTKDLFGIGDILAMQGGYLLMVQATDSSNHAARRKKALASANLAMWTEDRNRLFEIWSWNKKTGRLRIERLSRPAAR